MHIRLKCFLLRLKNVSFVCVLWERFPNNTSINIELYFTYIVGAQAELCSAFTILFEFPFNVQRQIQV